MSVTKERKQELIKEYGRTATDSGSPEVQISILTNRIAEMTGHLQGSQERLLQPPRSAADGESSPTSLGLRQAQEPAAVSRPVASFGHSQVSASQREFALLCSVWVSPSFRKPWQRQSQWAAMDDRPVLGAGRRVRARERFYCPVFPVSRVHQLRHSFPI